MKAAWDESYLKSSLTIPHAIPHCIIRLIIS